MYCSIFVKNNKFCYKTLTFSMRKAISDTFVIIMKFPTWNIRFAKLTTFLWYKDCIYSMHEIWSAVRLTGSHLIWYCEWQLLRIQGVSAFLCDFDSSRSAIGLKIVSLHIILCEMITCFNRYQTMIWLWALIVPDLPSPLVSNSNSNRI